MSRFSLLIFQTLVLLAWLSLMSGHGLAAERPAQSGKDHIPEPAMGLRHPDSVQESPLVKEPTGALGLGRALALALLKNHELASFSWEQRAREAEVLQAGLLPNPEAEIEADECGGSEERRGCESATTTPAVGQLAAVARPRARWVRGAGL